MPGDRGGTASCVVTAADREWFGRCRRLGLAVQRMVDPDVELEPFPSWSHCQWCAFREPRLAMNRGEDAELVLSTRYRRRAPGRSTSGRDVSDNRGLG